ncbi:hypothetical protein M0805_009354 [Coniferiporia weirii]|nr:hypothetical protein M0805_009354 [Coniferiporia weirii]
MMNSPVVFQCTMNELFADLLNKGVLIYLDDIIIYSKNPQEHTHLVKQVLQQLCKADFYCKPEKCYFNKKELNYLGFIVKEDRLKMDPYKVKAIQEWPDLKSKKEIRPLTKLMSKKRTFTWGEEQKQAFKQLKQLFCQDIMLTMPDPKKRFIVETDTCQEAAGAVLSQEDENRKYLLIAYYSKSFTTAEQKYH